MSEQSPDQSLPQTQWSLVARAHDTRSTLRRPALDELVRRYVPALRAHLVFRMRLDDADADDVVQGFLTEKLIERRLTAAADPSKGRFRSLLVRSLENYAIDMLRRNRRHAASASFTPDETSAAVDATAVHADVFDVAWARQVLVEALRTMRDECQSQGCTARWRLFEQRILRPILEDLEPPTYEAVVDEFHFASPQQASNALVTAKRHFERVLSQVVGEYADNDEEIERELADLRTIVRVAGPLDLRLDLLNDTQAACFHLTATGDSSRGAEPLAGLLALEARPESPWRTEDYPGLWLHQLAQPLVGLLDNFSGGLPRDSLPADVSTVADLLRHARPPLELLRSLKELARNYVRTGRHDFPVEIATALYYATIAVAIARLQQRITKSDDSVLEYGLRLLLTRAWLDEATRVVLQSVWSELSTANPVR